MCLIEEYAYNSPQWCMLIVEQNNFFLLFKLVFILAAWEKVQSECES